MSLDVVIAFLLVIGTSLTEVIELQTSEELPPRSVIVDLRALISKSGKFSDLQTSTFKAIGSDDIGNRLVDVSSCGIVLRALNLFGGTFHTNSIFFPISKRVIFHCT